MLLQGEFYVSSILKQLKKPLVALVTLSLFVNIGMLIQPFFFITISTSVILTRDKISFFYLIGVLLFVYLFVYFIDLLRYRILNRIAQLYDQIVSAATHQTVLNHTANNPGVVVIQPMAFLDMIRNFLVNGGAVGFLDLPFLPIFLIALYLLQPAFLVYALLSILLVAMLTFAEHFLTLKAMQKHAEKNGIAMQTLNTQLTAAEPILAMGMRNSLFERWQDQFLNALIHYKQQQNWYAKVSVLSKLVRQLMPVGIMGLGAYVSIQSSADGQNMSLFVVITASIIMARVIAVADTVMMSWKTFMMAVSAFNSLKKILLPLEQPPSHKIKLNQPITQVNLSGAVYVSSRTNAVLLNHLSISANAGEIWAIMGGIGSGKSTLGKLLLNIWPLTRGTLAYNSIDVRSLDFCSIGQRIGYLPQDIEFFSGTLAENIARFNVDIDYELLEQAAQMAGVSRWIHQLPKGYDTELEDNLNIISGGQRQQIALARAYYGFPSLLVLDEPNANLDEHGEALLNHALLFLKSRGSIVFIITHRTTVLSVADQLVRLERGSPAYVGPMPTSLSEAVS
ncbi:MAG: ATP-binding cassette domain-containing protein [Gammaproteobacteria bacterium]|nr:ATP-binding cassette domain-containing protein [Gammaproteobacteria bacterium]